MSETDSEITANRKFITIALRRARGQYNVSRTSQLSGVPQSTLYEWSRHGAYVPDFEDATPKSWSYRDLVFLRLMAWLRQRGMERSLVSEQVRNLRTQISKGFEVRYLFADRRSLIFEGEQTDHRSGYSILPFTDIAERGC